MLVALDELARSTRTSRSDLIRRAISALLGAAEEAGLDRRDEEGYRRIPEERELMEALDRLSGESAADA